MREIWKPIKEFEGIYSVSSLGNVRREKTESKIGTGNYARQEHILKQRKIIKAIWLLIYIKIIKDTKFLCIDLLLWLL